MKRFYVLYVKAGMWKEFIKVNTMGKEVVVEIALLAVQAAIRIVN